MSIDLGSHLGRIEHRQTITVEAPPPGLLDRELRALASKNVSARRSAVHELSWYTRDATRVVPALLACLSDPDQRVRTVALYSFHAFPLGAALHAKRFLEIVRGGERFHVETRRAAACLLAATAPLDGEVMAALEAMSKSEDEGLRTAGEYAFDTYRTRLSAKLASKPDR